MNNGNNHAARDKSPDKEHNQKKLLKQEKFFLGRELPPIPKPRKRQPRRRQTTPMKAFQSEINTKASLFQRKP
jgi:hypothetical protein